MTEPIPDAIQVGATYFYVIVLFVVGIAWALLYFESDPKKTVPALSRLTLTLLGVVAGATAVALNVTR